jgi:hypothetical protein
MYYELVEFFKRSIVEQEANPFPGCELTRLVLLFDARSTASQLRFSGALG